MFEGPRGAGRTGCIRTRTRLGWIAGLVLIGVLIGALAAGSDVAAQSPAPSPSPATKPAPRHVVAVVSSYFPPAYSLDSRGRPAGAAIDMIEAIAARANLSITYRIVDRFKPLMDAIRNGEADLIPSLQILPAREDVVAFTLPLATDTVVLFVRSGTTDIRGVADLAGRTVAVSRLSLARQALRGRKDVVVKSFDGYRRALFELLAGSVDALVYTRHVIEQVARDIGVADRIRVAGRPLAEIKSGIGVRRDDPALLERLNRAVKDFAGSAAYQRIFMKWYGRPVPFWRRPEVLWTGGVGLLVVIGLAGWRYLAVTSLHRRLRAAAAGWRQAEHRRRDSEERFKAAFENSGVGTILASPDGNFMDVNRSFADFLGYTRSELIGRNIKDLLPHDEMPRSDERLRDLQLGSSQAATMERRYVHKDGRVVWGISNLFMVRNDDGTPRYIIGNVQDITERKRAEEALRQREFQLREIIDLVPHLIFIKDREGRFRLVNKAVAEAHGTSPEALIGKTLETSCTRKEEIAQKNRDDREVMATGQPKLIPHEALYDADGNTRILRTVKVPYVDPESGETWVLGVAVDITELQATQEALHHVQKLDALGKLTGGIAHDFNNLLTIILGNIQLMGRELEDGKLRSFVANAEAAAQRGAALTKRLLAFGRQQALEPKIIDLNELVLGLIDMLARTIGDNIEIKTATLPGLHKTLADPAQVENVILNLVINARDAMPEGGTLTIETANVHLDEDDAALHGEVAPGDYVMVAVTDNGVGMPADVADRAFDPFFTTKGLGGGNGLGLSMVYGFCRQSGGHAVIESVVGAGTTIRVYLPDAAGDESGRAAAGAGAWPQKTVLVVEDDPAMRGFAVTTLIGLGYEVLEAADAEVAASVLESNGKIDLLFTDIMLPDGADGRELAASATARHPAIRVLYATGRAPEEGGDKRSTPDEVQLLYKPYSGSDLAINIGQLLEGGT